MVEKQPPLTRIEDEDRAKHTTDPSAGDLRIHEHLLMPEDEHWAAQLFTARTGHVAIVPLDSNRLLDIVRIRLDPVSSLALNRSERGRYSSEKVRWIHAPECEPATHRLVWAYTDGFISRDPAAPFDLARGYVAILGRTQTVSASLIKAPPETTVVALNQLQTLMTGIVFADGQRYQDYRGGDLTATIDLAGFVTGPETLAEAGVRRRITEESPPPSLLHFLWIHLHYVAIGLLLVVGAHQRRDGQRHECRKGLQRRP